MGGSSSPGLLSGSLFFHSRSESWAAWTGLGWEVLSPVLCWGRCWGMWASLEPGPLEPEPQHRQWVGPAWPLARQGGRGAETRPPEAAGVPLSGRPVLWLCVCFFPLSEGFLRRPHAAPPGHHPGPVHPTVPPAPRPPGTNRSLKRSPGCGVTVAGVGPCGRRSGQGRFPGGQCPEEEGCPCCRREPEPWVAPPGS